MIQKVDNREIDKTNEKVVDTLGGWNIIEKENEGDQAIIIK